MTGEDIINWLRRFRYDPDWRDSSGNRKVPFKNLADYCGVDRRILYKIMHRAYPHFHSGTRIFSRLEDAIDLIADGRLYWERQAIQGRRFEMVMVREVDEGDELRVPQPELP